MTTRNKIAGMAILIVSVTTIIAFFSSFKTNHMKQENIQQELADKSAIEDLLIRYSYAVDFRDWSSYEQVFTKDAVIDYRAFGGPRTNVQEQIVYLKKALTPIESSQHTISTILIDLKGDTARVRCICHCPMVLKLKDGKTQVFFCGLWYNDVVVRTTDGWRIKERVEQKSYIHNMPEGFEF
jgi:3-phenylpropionate/cinnamic acid dioxygenase small subunit